MFRSLSLQYPSGRRGNVVVIYYRDTQNVVATNFEVRHDTSEPNRTQSPEYGRTGGPIGVVLQCRASLQPAT